MSNDAAAAHLPSPPTEPSYASPVCDSSASSPTPETHSQSFGRPAPRALNPAPLSTRPAQGIAIATAPSPPQTAYPSPGVGGPCNGPTSTTYVIPPRPKPGRKPATDEPASKRKAQNRESQRAFRARKAAKLNEMKTQVEVAEMRHRQEMHEKMMEMADKDLRIRQLESMVDQYREAQERIAQERDAWKDKALQLEEFVKNVKERRNSSSAWQSTYPSPSTFTPQSSTLHSYDVIKSDDVGCGSCKADGPCACLEAVANEAHNIFLPPVPLNLGPPHTTLPPDKPNLAAAASDDPAQFEEREIDFTAKFAKRPRLEIASLLQPTEAGCGFCTADSYCVCRDTALQALQPSHDDVAPASRNEDTTMTDVVPLKSKRRDTSGPGSCDACQRDPKQRAWCQRVAQLRTSESGNSSFRSAPSSRASSIVSSDIGSPMEPRLNYPAVPDRDRSIGCSDAYKLFDGRVETDRESMDWSTLKPIAPDTHREPLPSIQASTGANKRQYSALELDTAGVIATLQQTMGPLTPRKQDGKHANLVRIADEFRRASQSPRVSMSPRMM